MLQSDPNAHVAGGQRGQAAPQHPPSHLPDVLFLCMERRKLLFPLFWAVPAFGRNVLAFSSHTLGSHQGGVITSVRICLRRARLGNSP